VPAGTERGISVSVLSRIARGLGIAATLLVLGGCSDARHEGSNTKVIRLWIAPNELEERFWKIAVERWNSEHRGAKVEFTTIPATGGSEEAILTALVSGSGPDIADNIFPGFAAQLANLGQLTDLANMPAFARIVEARHMEPMLEEAKVAGHQYLLPLYFSPTLIWWRSDILAALGINGVPRTFEDVYDLSRRRAAWDGKLGMQVLAGREWRSRWYDYIAYYYAGSDGAAYISGRKALYEDPASLEALDFIHIMFQNHWTGLDFDTDDPLPRGEVAGAAHGAWDLAYYRQNHPQTLKHIEIGPMLRSRRAEAADPGKAHTFADCKGMVLFKSSKVQAEALEFIAWVFGNDSISLLWFQETGMPPARGDLTTNPIFRKLYREDPLIAEYASYVDVARPTAPIEETIDVNKIMSVRMVEAVNFDAKPVREAAADAARLTDRLLERAQ
jgi:multiple sugar transport system substrate-binding protein